MSNGRAVDARARKSFSYGLVFLRRTGRANFPHDAAEYLMATETLHTGDRRVPDQSITLHPKPAFGLRLWSLGHRGLGQEQHTSNGNGASNAQANDLRRIDDSRFDEINTIARGA
jgi:hypothetical protein